MSNMKNYNYTKDNWWFLGELPPKNGRYIIVDTETTGFSNQCNNVIELAAIEVFKGKLTGLQFHGYLRPRNPIDPKAQEKHKLGNTFYEDYFNDVYHSDKATLENFLKFVGNSLIFAHNASFDYHFINNELKHWKLPIINKGRFRCTMRIFREIFSQVDVNYKKYCSLAKCCEYFNLKSSKYSFHTAIFDSFMTGRLLCKIYDYVETRINIENINNSKQSINFNTKNVDLQLLTNGNNIFKNNFNFNNSNIINKNGDGVNFPQNSIYTLDTNKTQNIEENTVIIEKTTTEENLSKETESKEGVHSNINILERSEDNDNAQEKIFSVFKIDKLTTNSTSPQMIKESPPDSFTEHHSSQNLMEDRPPTNTFDNDILFIQEYEGFINNYMNDDKETAAKHSDETSKSPSSGTVKESNDHAAFENPDPNIIFTNELSKDFVSNENEENQNMRDFDINNHYSGNPNYDKYLNSPMHNYSENPSFSRSHSSYDDQIEDVNVTQRTKYKELMRKFVNAFKKANDFNYSVEKFKEDTRDDLQLNMEDIEEIIRDNL